jgi:hypothetical protein
MNCRHWLFLVPTAILDGLIESLTNPRPLSSGVYSTKMQHQNSLPIDNRRNFCHAGGRGLESRRPSQNFRPLARALSINASATCTKLLMRRVFKFGQDYWEKFRNRRMDTGVALPPCNTIRTPWGIARARVRTLRAGRRIQKNLHNDRQLINDARQTFDRRLSFIRPKQIECHLESAQWRTRIRPPVRHCTASHSMPLLHVLDREERFAKVRKARNGLRLNRVPLRRLRQTPTKKRGDYRDFKRHSKSNAHGQDVVLPAGRDASSIQLLSLGTGHSSWRPFGR